MLLAMASRISLLQVLFLWYRNQIDVAQVCCCKSPGMSIASGSHLKIKDTFVPEAVSILCAHPA